MVSIQSQPPSREARLQERVRGHVQTLVPFFRRSLSKVPVPETAAFRAQLTDPDVGPVRLSGRFYAADGPRCVVFIHGLGGSSDSGYMKDGLRAAAASGVSCLLLNTRGSDRSGEDLSHAGLGADLDAVLASPELSGFESVDLFGYSLGGQLGLRYAAGEPHEKLGRVAAVGSPLLLGESADAFDAPRFSVYRRHVMESLYQIYTAAYQRRPQGIEPHVARRITKIRDWDGAVVAPRFGFASADAYYRAASSGYYLAELKRDCLYVGAAFDPMVPPRAVVPALPAARLKTAWDLGAGHLGFGQHFDLGLGGRLGLEAQVLSWLAAPGE